MRVMCKKNVLTTFVFLAGLSVLPLQGQSGLVVKLRFYEGMRSVIHEPPSFITSSYLHPLVSASIPSGFEPTEEKNQIKKVFNLLDVRLLTEADLGWGPREYNAMTYVLRFDSRENLVMITPIELRNRFRIEIFDQAGELKINLLNTEIILPRKNIAVFGFESTAGIPYFLSFHVLPEDTLKPMPREVEKVGGIVRGTIRAEGDIKPPRLLGKVNPVYPEIARQAGVEGIVILETVTDIQGNVVNVRVLRSIPLLDQAAVDAVRQWKYEPVVIDGKPRGIVFTITVRFSLKD